MKLYEFAPTRSIRARWTLQELGVAFEVVPVNLLAGEHRRPEFLKINPAGKIPVLVDGDWSSPSRSRSCSTSPRSTPTAAAAARISRRARAGPPLAAVRRDRAGAAALAHRAQHDPVSRGRSGSPSRRDDREPRVPRDGGRARAHMRRTAVRRRRRRDRRRSSCSPTRSTGATSGSCSAASRQLRAYIEAHVRPPEGAAAHRRSVRQHLRHVTEGASVTLPYRSSDPSAYASLTRWLDLEIILVDPLTSDLRFQRRDRDAEPARPSRASTAANESLRSATTRQGDLPPRRARGRSGRGLVTDRPPRWRRRQRRTMRHTRLGWRTFRR